MSSRILNTLVLCCGFSLSQPSGAATLTSPRTLVPAAPSVEVVEFYDSALDHYFMTADAAEIAALDGGTIAGWARTGYRFQAFASPSTDPSLSPVCRYYGRPDAGLDSHFYSASPDECAIVATKFASSWVLESDNVFKVRMPDLAGSCPASTHPVYRVFNNRTDANHRYTVDVGVRQSMIAKGGVAEGYGPDGVAFCTDAASGGGSVAPPAISVSIIATQLAPDMFSFSTSVTAAVGAAMVAYGWNFGDGDTESGSTVSHRFAVPGSYSVSLTVTDDRGNTASATKAVAVAPPGAGAAAPPAGKSDFDARKSAPGVVRWFDFDTTAQLGVKNGYGQNVQNVCGTATCPVIDTTVKASGGGSMRFDVPTKTADNPAGYWSSEFSPDLSLRFGENSEFYVQWRQRFNQAFIDTRFVQADGTQQEGGKQMILGAGNTPTKIYNSCEATEVVVQSYYQSRIPISYNSCTGSASHGAYAGFYEPQPDGDWRIQNGTAPYCMFNTGGPNCFRWVANEWLTFKVWIKLGPRNLATNEFDNSEFKLWAARDGQPSQLLVWWHPGIPGYFPLTAGEPGDQLQSFGKVTLLPYMTGNSATLDHPLAQTWYDELIISKQDIADPAMAVALPKWRQGMAVGKFAPISGTAALSGYRWPLPDPTSMAGAVDAWQGFAQAGTRWFSAAASGHGEWQNPVLSVDLAVDAPKWTVLHPGSAFAAAVKNGPYYADGLPVSRHTYYTTQYVSAAQARDGKERVMLVTSYATYGIDTGPGSFGGGPQVDGFRVADKAWDAAGTWADMCIWQTLPSIASDPRTGDVYYSADWTSAKWSPKTGGCTLLQGAVGLSETGLAAWNDMPSLVDVKRNRLCGLIDARGMYGRGNVRLQCFDLATLKISNTRVTGMPTTPTAEGGETADIFETGFFVDTDQDRYVDVWTDGRVYAIDPATGVATLIATGPAAAGSVHSRAAYFPSLGGFAYLPSFDSPILFMPTR